MRCPVGRAHYLTVLWKRKALQNDRYSIGKEYAMFPHPNTACYLRIRQNEELLREAALAHYIRESTQSASAASPIDDSVAFVHRFLAALAAVGSIAKWSRHLTTS